MFRAGKKASWALEAGTSDNSGTAPDHLSARTVVPIGVKFSTQLLNLLATNGHTVTVEEFMASQDLPATQTGVKYVLLVGERHICSNDRQEMAAILGAKANGLPNVLERFEKSEFKTLTGLGLKSEAAVGPIGKLGGQSQAGKSCPR